MIVTAGSYQILICYDLRSRSHRSQTLFLFRVLLKIFLNDQIQRDKKLQRYIIFIDLYNNILMGPVEFHRDCLAILR